MFIREARYVVSEFLVPPFGNPFSDLLHILRSYLFPFFFFLWGLSVLLVYVFEAGARFDSALGLMVIGHIVVILDQYKLAIPLHVKQLLDSLHI